MTRVRLCCIACSAASPAPCDRVHVISDGEGRRWRFEAHPYIGPIVLLGMSDTPAARQPGDKSPFWAAYDAWLANRHQQTHDHHQAPIRMDPDASPDQGS